YATDVSRQVAAVDARVKYNYISTLTELSRELFVSTEGARIDQSFALTQGTCSVVTVQGEVSQDLYDAIGHQRGWEILLDGASERPLTFPAFRDFALGLAREGVELAAAPVLPTSDGDVVVVTDPHYNTLLPHEIIGPPVELARARGHRQGGRPRLLRGGPPDAVDRREPRELPHLGAPGLRDPERRARPALPRRRHRRRLARLPGERRRGRLRLSRLPDPELRQGTTDADQAPGQRRADDADAGARHRRLTVRGSLIAAIVAGVMLASAAPAAPPESPVG